MTNHWSVEVDGVRADNAAWGYRHPSPLARRVKGRIAFWNGVQVHSTPTPTSAPTRWGDAAR